MVRTPRHLRDTVRLLDAFAKRAARRGMHPLTNDLQRVRDALTFEDGLPLIQLTLKDLADRTGDNPEYQATLYGATTFLREAQAKRVKCYTVEEDLDIIERSAEACWDSPRRHILDAVKRLRESEGRDRGE